MCSDCAVLLSIRVAAMSRTSAVRETACLCKQLSFIDLRRTLNQLWTLIMFSVCCLMMPLLEVRQNACEEDAGRPGAYQPHFSPSASDQTGMFDGEQNPLCVFQVWASAKRRLIKEWPPDRWQITREPTAFSHHPLQCCPGASCLPHLETPPEVSQRSWWVNSSLQLRMINQLHSETVHEVIVEQRDNFKNDRYPCDTNWSTWPSKFSGSLGVVERHFGKW